MKFTISWLKEHLDTKYNESKIIANAVLKIFNILEINKTNKTINIIIVI